MKQNLYDSSYDSSASGFIADSFEGISASFTDIEVISTSEVNVVARAMRYGRRWLLKGLQPDAAVQEVCRQRLRKEFEILVQLQHPSIAAAVGMEQVEGPGHCIICEYVDGVTLAEWLAGETTRRQRLDVARQLVAAVAYIHSKNIVHRDLKPANIIVTRNGANVKLIDFGLADTDSHAVLKQPAGTPRYMSPEQRRTADADVRNDIYSLGVIFSQMNLGRERIVRRCLLSAERRYQNMAELQTAMQSRDRRPARIAVCAVAAVVAVLCAVSVVQTLRLNRVRSEQGAMASARARVENAIADGHSALDRALQASGIAQMADTLSCRDFLPADYVKRIIMIHNTVKTLTDSLGNSFSESERTEITNALYLYDERILTSLTARIANLPQTPDRQ